MKVGCTSCHNPHGGEGGKMLVDLTVNNVCYTCHAEKRGPFLWDHPPVRENCRSEEHTSELQSHSDLVCRLLLEKKKKTKKLKSECQLITAICVTHDRRFLS